MDYNITKQNMQVSPPSLNPDQAAAALAFATKISEGLMPKVQPGAPTSTPPEGSQALEISSGSEKPSQNGQLVDFETKVKEIEDRIDKKMETMKNDILEAINKYLG